MGLPYQGGARRGLAQGGNALRDLLALALHDDRFGAEIAQVGEYALPGLVFDDTPAITAQCLRKRGVGRVVDLHHEDAARLPHGMSPTLISPR
ncbi:hypothetical protein AD428_09425 [Achromobacter sp. DMS1]|uniref:hypothetical protein n=1 Tax=Achromobacter sp. DMS1 TaxID=1688405 RepID=UPI0006C104C3|nr:hypothetical protein [Achromobacter sp. DMS1]KOF54071.1 hypothetical protein AD428_09425 [Achromobacter sp. DMS1]